MAQQRAPPPELIDDAVTEILLRIPPDSSAYLVRASMVCKPWRRIISDPDFTRRHREFHLTPPLLGFLHNSYGRGCLFFPTITACPFPQSAFDFSRWWRSLDCLRLCALDCRHGRVLLRDTGTRNLLVWDSITGDQEELHDPHIAYKYHSTVVLCAVAGCDHCDCHGDPFLVVFVGSNGGSVHGCVYSSETHAWGTPVSVSIDECDYDVHLKHGSLIGDDAYFIRVTVANDVRVLKYELDKNFLSAIEPPDGSCRNSVIMPTDDGFLGLARIRGPNLYVSSRKVNPKGFASWVRYRIIELEKLFPINISFNRNHANLIGFAEGVGVMFVSIVASTYMIELKSGQVRKVSEFGRFYNVLPFMSFYTPSCVRAKLPLPAETN